MSPKLPDSRIPSATWLDKLEGEEFLPEWWEEAAPWTQMITLEALFSGWDDRKIIVLDVETKRRLIRESGLEWNRILSLIKHERHYYIDVHHQYMIQCYLRWRDNKERHDDEILRHVLPMCPNHGYKDEDHMGYKTNLAKIIHLSKILGDSTEEELEMEIAFHGVGEDDLATHMELCRASEKFIDLQMQMEHQQKVVEALYQASLPPRYEVASGLGH